MVLLIDQSIRTNRLKANISYNQQSNLTDSLVLYIALFAVKISLQSIISIPLPFDKPKVMLRDPPLPVLQT